MDTLIRGHFDGKVIVPDEPVELPVGEPLEIVLRPVPAADVPLSDAEVERRLYWLRQLEPVSVPPIPDEALRRENLYEERP